MTVVTNTLQTNTKEGRTDETLRMFTIRNFHIHNNVHLYVTNINITNRTCNLTTYYAIICNTLVTTNNSVCNKHSNTFPSKGKEELFGSLNINVSYQANL